MLDRHTWRGAGAPFRRVLFTCLITELLCGLMLPPESRAQQTTQEVDFRIGAQLLESALVEFGAQARIQIAAAADDISGVRTAGVNGRRAVEDALIQLLRGTGLEYRRVSDRTYRVSRAASKSALAPAASPIADAARAAESASAVPHASDRDVFGGTEQSPRAQEPGARPALDLAEVLVTGSHIRGTAPVGANLIVIGRDKIEQTAFATVQDVLHSLPQNFGGGANEDTNLGGGDSTNTSWGSTLNLRGLGSGSTLVLLNGRRLAPAGLNASFTDVSSIPLTAIERIDVLPDGASATYGADAIGGVVNVILRKDYSGAETSLRYGAPTEGGGNTYQAGQTLGFKWATGDSLLSYEFFRRDALAATDRSWTASADLRPLGGDDFRSNFSNPGTIVAGTRTWAIPAGSNGTGLTTPGALVEGTRNQGDPNATIEVLPRQLRHAAFASFNQRLGERVELSLSALYSQRDAEGVFGGQTATLSVPMGNAFYVNPTGGTGNVSVRYNFVDDLGPTISEVDTDTAYAAVGLEAGLFGKWRLRADGSYGKEEIEQTTHNRTITTALTAALADSNPATAFNPFGDGSFTNPATLEAIRGTLSFGSRSTLASGSVVTSGPLFELPAGDLALALGGEYREQAFETSTQTTTGGSTFRPTEADRDITAGFVELQVPIFGADNARAGFESLRLSIAARHERYSDFGSATTPRFGLTWSPLRAMTLRGSWGKSFKAPTLADMNEASSVINLQNQPSASGNVQVLRWSGGNADVTEETATSWTAGFDVALSDEPRIALEATYFDIRFKDRILIPPSGAFLTDPTLAPFVTLNPTAAQRAEVCSRGTFLGVNPGDCLNAPIGAIIDSRFQNIADTRSRGIDVGANYGTDSRAGKFSFGVNATYLIDLKQAELRDIPLREILNSPRNPVDLRMRGSASWERSALGAAVYVNYVDEYSDTLSTPARPIDSWTTCDVQLRYETGEARNDFLDGVSVALNAENVFDEEPPFFNNPAGLGFDPTNADLLGRTVSLQLRKIW